MTNDEPIPAATPTDWESFDRILAEILREADAQAGTIHVFDVGSGLLKLAAHDGIPASVLEKIETVPIGKGLAGLAAERLEPVQVCNLQTDASGVARPNARQIPVQGSVALPILHRDKLCAVLGIAKSTPHEWSQEECSHFAALGEAIVKIIKKNSNRN